MTPHRRLGSLRNYDWEASYLAMVETPSTSRTWWCVIAIRKDGGEPEAIHWGGETGKSQASHCLDSLREGTCHQQLIVIDCPWNIVPDWGRPENLERFSEVFE